MDNGTSSSTLYSGDAQILLSGMMVIDLIRHRARNVSMSGMKESQLRVGGVMQYVGGISLTHEVERTIG